MKNTILFLLGILVFINCPAQTNNIFNFDFEQPDKSGKLPAVWQIWYHPAEYDFYLDSLVKFSGKYALCIEASQKESQENYAFIGWLNPLNAKAKKIEVTAKIKTQDAKDGFAALFLITKNKFDELKQTHNFDQKIGGSQDWQTYTLTMDYPEDAVAISTGLMFTGTGKTWIDAVKLTVNGKDIQRLDSSYFTPLRTPLEKKIVPDSISTNLIISTQHPLSAKAKDARRSIYKECVRLSEIPAKAINAHPSASIFPGAVVVSTPRISRKIQLYHTPIPDSLKHIVANLHYSGKDKPTMYSTGLYAAPGDMITIEIPQNLKNKVSVQIGCQSDNLNQWMAAEEDWRRMPLIVRSDLLTSVKNRVASAFGGLIYITCPPNAPVWDGEITIKDAVAAPYFVLGKTTDEEWNKMIKESGAPWGELETDNIILTISTENLSKIKDPTKQAHTWDLIVSACYDLAQIPTPYFRKQRIVSDVHIGGGAMHSGYPIMASHCPSRHLESEFSIADPGKLLRPSKGGANWGFFHEIGHNMQNVKDWVFNGTTEVSVNFFSLYIFDHVLGGRNDAHEGISIESTRNMMKKYFEDGARFDDWKQNPFLGLVTFRQIQTDFGWEPFKAVFRRFHQGNAKDNNRQYSDQEKIDNFVTYFSEATGRNFTTFFKTWGIPVSPVVGTKLAEYPEWMPYNFPPKK